MHNPFHGRPWPAALVLSATVSVWAETGERNLPLFAVSDESTARAAWVPRFGSLPPRVDASTDGTHCLAFPAEFAKRMDRVCWDRKISLDLSDAGAVRFELLTTNRPATGPVGIYFGTAHGWYARFIQPGPSGTWRTVTVRRDSFKTEDSPDGWDKIDKFRFSVWAERPGKAVYLLRNFRVLPDDPAENFVKNGSFEIVSGGMPYAWSSGHWGVGHMPWAVDMDLWRRRWHVDSSTAKHGRRSLRIVNTPDLPLLAARSVWIQAPDGKRSWSASVWLKADRDGLPVVLSCGGRSKEVAVGCRWTQAFVRPDKPGRWIVSIAPKAPGTLWIDAVQVQTLPKPTPEFHPSHGDAAIAERERAVDWSHPRRTADVASGRRVTGPVRRANVRIDAHGRFLVDGRPYVQHSLGLEFVSDPAILDFAAKSGFKDVCIQIRPAVSTDRLKSIFDRCATAGLRIIPWLDGRIPRERFIQHIRTLKSHPALLCWYVFDEPSGAKFAEAEERFRLAKELDPDHPAFINYLGNHLENQRGDIYSTDVYPVPHSHPTAAIDAVERMSAAAAKEHKPVWMWIQGTGYAYWMDREPTPRELSCMVYGSLIAGARGIYYFAQIPRTKACFDEMRALCVEVDAVAPYLYSLEPAPEVRCDNPSVMSRAYRLGNETVVIAVNRDSTPLRGVRFTMVDVQGPGEVMFEGRRPVLQGNTWRDDFGPFERRVYRFGVR